MGIRIHKGVATFPLNLTPRRAALTFAGNIARSSRISPHAAHCRVGATKRPIAPAISRSPVSVTSRSGRGNPGGTMAIRSFLGDVKCAIAVKTNIVASAKRAHVNHVCNACTPIAPNPLYSSSDPNSTTKTAMPVLTPPQSLAINVKPEQRRHHVIINARTAETLCRETRAQVPGVATRRMDSVRRCGASFSPPL
jgi:hypothetical protein